MTFPEADEFNAVHGTRFIADLMPKTPIYVDLLADGAKAVMGQPHPSGRAALRMLEAENFTFDRYIDIFDGGPTVTAHTDKSGRCARRAPKPSPRSGMPARQDAGRRRTAEAVPRRLRIGQEAAQERRLHR